jgi:hypothetical protein
LRDEFLEGLPVDFGSVNGFAVGIDRPERLYFGWFELRRCPSWIEAVDMPSRESAAV